MKKAMASLLVLALLFAAGCADGAGTPESASAEAASQAEGAGADSSGGGMDVNDLYHLDGTMPMVKDPENAPTMTMLMVCEAQVVVEPGEMIQVQRLNEDTGMVFDWIKVPYEGATEKINLMIASRDLPDVFWNHITEAMVVQYMDQDVFVPTEDLTEQYMPRLSAIYEEAPTYKGLATTPNGHRYGFPYIEECGGLILTPGPFMINEVWLEKVGKSMPNTLDECADCLRAFKAAGDLNGNGQDDEFPFAFGLGSFGGWGSFDAFHTFTGAFGMSDVQVNEYVEDHTAIDNGKVIFTATDEAFKETAKFFHTLSSEGLIDPDSFSPHPSGGNSALYRDKMKAADAIYGSVPTWAPLNELPVKEVYDQYAVLPRLSGPNGKIGFRSNLSEMFAAVGCAITTACPYPEAVAVWVDYLFEPEIAATTNHGPLDYHYIKTDDGRMVFNENDDGSFNLLPEYETYSEQRMNLTPIRGSTAILNRYYDEFLAFNFDAVDLYEMQNASGKAEIMEEFEDRIMPHLMYDIEEQRTLSQIQPQLKNIITSYKMQWILDGNADETWEQYKSELNAAGLEQYLSILQTGYDRYKG